MDLVQCDAKYYLKELDNLTKYLLLNSSTHSGAVVSKVMTQMMTMTTVSAEIISSHFWYIIIIIIMTLSVNISDIDINIRDL